VTVPDTTLYRHLEYFLVFLHTFFDSKLLYVSYPPCSDGAIGYAGDLGVILSI
jgi:hypothetical protein